MNENTLKLQPLTFANQHEAAPASIVPSHWRPINLEELNAQAAMQTRVDRKYIVDAKLAQKVLATLPAQAAVLTMDGKRDFAYDSVYFDNPALQSYRLAAHGRRNRFKIRTRTYCDTGDTFLEVKTEGARAVTVKERIPYQIADRARLNTEGRRYVNEALGDMLECPVTDFEPVLATNYRRTTVFLPEAENNPVNSRMTIDCALTWTPLSELALSPATPFEVGEHYVAEGMVIIETKSSSAPSVADKHLWQSGIRPTKISKFATGMAALNAQLPANKWRRTIRRNIHLSPTEKTRSLHFAA